MQPVSIIALSALLGYWLAPFVGRQETWKEGRRGSALSATLLQYGLTLALIGLFDLHLMAKPRLYWILLIAATVQGLVATRWLFSRLALRESLWGFLALHAFAAAIAVAAAMLILQ